MLAFHQQLDLVCLFFQTLYIWRIHDGPSSGTNVQPFRKVIDILSVLWTMLTSGKCKHAYVLKLSQQNAPWTLLSPS